LTIVELVEAGESVLIQSSYADNNDAEVQLASLAELLLDPYYRTVEGEFAKRIQ
jgi:hypothetical protein